MNSNIKFLNMKKKYLMSGIAAVAMVFATSCSRYDVYDADVNRDQAVYEQAFVSTFGEPAPAQDWGFGDFVTRGTTRAASAEPSVAEISQPYDEAWVADYLETATEPTSTNVNHNYDNGTTFGWANIVYNGIENDPDYEWFVEYCQQAVYQNWSYYSKFGLTDTSWNKVLAWLYPQIIAKGHESWLTNINIDNDFVLNFKITDTWNGDISVVATEGLTDGVENGNQRTVVVTGTWNVTSDQRVGSLGKIVIANGGTVNVASGKKLSFVNQARLVVLPGGTLTGDGTVEVSNGTAEGYENYNGGTIDVAKFNNNYGKFFNYGRFLVNEYDAGATESNFYNHSLVAIDHTGTTPNARIFNGCQFYVRHDARVRNYEGINGSALIVDGQFMPFGSEDATTVPSFVNLAAGALVKCGSLYNGSSWTGPTSGGYAALEIVNQIDYMTWAQDSPQTAGYFANNLYVKCGTWQNDPAGQGYHQDDPSDTENYKLSRAEYKFWSVAANCTGNGNVTKLVESTKVIFPADDDFVKGVSGCTPGYTGDVPDGGDDDEFVPVCRILAEDLGISATNTENSDFDFNDVVFDVMWVDDTHAKIRLMAAGGTLPLYIQGVEVHGKFGVSTGTMVNTYEGKHAVKTPVIFGIEGSFANEAGERDPNLIRVQVFKNKQLTELTAERGRVASKICVDPDLDWCNERQYIDGEDAYNGQFTEWVQGRRAKYYK